MEEKKKINTKRKGETKENRCVHELVRNGFNVFFKSRTIKMGPYFQGIDFADLFDVVAARIRLRPPYIEWLFISVRNREGDSSFGAHRNAIREWASRYLPIGCTAQLWCGKKKMVDKKLRRGWRIWKIGKVPEEDYDIEFKEGEVEV